MEKKNRVGEKHITKNYGNLTIIEYENAHNITVQFEDNTVVKNVSYKNIKKGSIRNPFYPRVYGVGYSGIGQYNVVDHLEHYGCWADAMRRTSKGYQINRPTYKDVKVCEQWCNFQLFAEWYESNWKTYMNNWQLDKDILVKGNKIYSPETCCFVPSEINTLFTKRQNKRGDYPLGVQKEGKRFKAQININKEKIYLGMFDTIEEAFQAYKTAKEAFIKEVADKWKPLIEPNVYTAMYNYQVEITD